ncbi:MAG: hypothetical protein PUG48_07410 [Clostridia bacterium]|nr:hypothetical protein [Clostridia bacterium]
MDKNNEKTFKRGDVLKVLINDDSNISKPLQKIRNKLKNEYVSKVIILSKTKNGYYIAVKCSDTKKRCSQEVVIDDSYAYAYYHHFFIIDPDSLVKIPNSELKDKDNILKIIEYKYNEKVEKKKIKREQRSKKNIPLSNKHKITSKNGYIIVLLKNTNQKAFISKIYLTNYMIKSCPICNNNLSNYINIIPISKTNGIKTPGAICYHCNIFFENNGTNLINTVKSLSNLNNIEVNTDYIILNYKQKINLLKSIKSISAIVHLRSVDDNKDRIVAIVSSISDRNHNQDVFHYTDLFARKIIFAFYRKNKYIHTYIHTETSKYKIINYTTSLQEEFAPLNFISVNKVFLRKGGGLYHGISEDNIENIAILLYSPFTNCFEVANASYNSEYKEYYMDIKVFRNFVYKYGNPGIELIPYRSGLRDFSTMQEESLLHAYGYNVSQNKGLSDSKRHALLSEVLDLEIMSASNIIGLLDHNINMHPGNQYQHARMCWQQDKEFVMNYKVNPERFIVATIGL